MLLADDEFICGPLTYVNDLKKYGPGRTTNFNSVHFYRRELLRLIMLIMQCRLLFTAVDMI